MSPSLCGTFQCYLIPTFVPHILIAALMSDSSRPGGAEPVKIPREVRHALSTSTRSATRYRSRKTVTRTTEEKAILAKNRKERADQHREALDDIHATIETAAQNMASTLGLHKADHYLQEIYQAGRAKGKERRVNTWNAFQSMRIKEINSGTSLYS